MSVLVQDMFARIYAEFGITRAQLTGRSHVRPVSEARQIAYWFLRERKGWTYARIGSLFNRDHSTIVYGVRSISGRMEYDTDLQEKAARITSREKISAELVLPTRKQLAEMEVQLNRLVSRINPPDPTGRRDTYRRVAEMLAVLQPLAIDSDFSIATVFV